METTPDRGVMLVTGGGRGIGASASKLAAQRGWAVAIVYRERSEEAQRVVAVIESYGGRAHAIRADVTQEEEILRAFGEADRLGLLTALVNNAGGSTEATRVEDITAEKIDRVFAVNVRAAFLCAREAIKRMSTKHGGQGGSIVNVGSGASQLGSPGVWVHYAAAKGALDSMTIGLAKEVAGEGIRVNLVRPGLIETEAQARRPPGQLEQLARTVPMGRMGTPDEMAHSIVWLADPNESPHVTGTFIDARGGF